MAHHHHDEDDMEDTRRRAQQSIREKDTRGRFKLPQGTTHFWILKTPSDKERHSPPTFLEYLAHRNIGPKKRYARCGCRPGENDPHKCWLHKKAQQLTKKGRTKEASLLNPIKILAIQVAVEDKDTDEVIGPLLWETNSGIKATSLGYKLLNICCNPKMSKYLDPKKGYGFKVKRKGEGLATEYGDVVRDDEKSSVPKEIIKRLKPFVDLEMQKYDEEWQKSAYYGTEGEDKDMAAKGKKKSRKADASSSSSDASDASSSSSDASDASSESSSSSDASSSSSDSSSSDKKTKKKKKSKKKESSDSSSSSSDASSSSSDASSSSSDASSSDASSSSSDASSSSSSSSSSSDEKPKRGRPAKAKAKSKKKKKK